MLCKATYCAGHISANTRPHQLCSGVTGRWGLLSHAREVVGSWTSAPHFTHTHTHSPSTSYLIDHFLDLLLCCVIQELCDEENQDSYVHLLYSCCSNDLYRNTQKMCIMVSLENSSLLLAIVQMEAFRVEEYEGWEVTMLVL